MTTKALTTGNPAIDRFLAHCHRRKYASKSTIIRAGDKPDVLYYVLKGGMTVSIEDANGRSYSPTSTPATSSARWACSTKAPVAAPGCARALNVNWPRSATPASAR